LRLFVAIPAYDGKVGIETVRSLLDEQGAAALLGVEIQVGLLPGCSLITMGRNQLVADFLATDCDRLVFIDADVSWTPGDLIRLAAHPVDVVGGAYRYKKAEEDYPIRWLDKPALWADPETGLLEVDSVPGGFLAISRQTFEKLREAHPERAYMHEGRQFHGYFHAPVEAGRIWGEDTAFCNDWRKTGGQVWLDIEPLLTHTGGHNNFTGSVRDWLRARMIADPAAALAALEAA
jgi:hypothetical protein